MRAIRALVVSVFVFLVPIVSAFAATLSLGYAPNPAYWGQTVTMTATLDTQGDAIVPNGMPNFFVTGAPIPGTAWASTGAFTYTSTATFAADGTTFAGGPPITTTLTVTYVDAHYTPQVNGTVSFTVNALVPTVTVGGTSPVTFSPTAQINLTTTVVDNFGNPSTTATVRFYYALAAAPPAGPPSSFGTVPGAPAIFLGNGTFAAPGSWTFTAPAFNPPPVGQSYWIFSIFDGTATIGRGFSTGYFQQDVLPWPTTATLTGAPANANVGQQAILTVSLLSAPPISGGYPGGCAFNFFDNGVQINGSPVTLTSNTAATFQITFAASGTHVYSAQFIPTTCAPNLWSAATSNSQTTVVAGAATPTTTVLQSNLNPSNFGQSVTFTATVTGAAPPPVVVVNGQAGPTGTVNFLDGVTLLGSGTINAFGVATVSTSVLAIGSHPITAAYTGSAAFAASVSPVVTQVVNGGPPPVITGTPIPALGGQGLIALLAALAATAFLRLRR